MLTHVSLDLVAAKLQALEKMCETDSVWKLNCGLGLPFPKTLSVVFYGRL